MSKKPLAQTNRRIFEVLWVLLIFALFSVGINSALMVYHSLASAIEEVARFGVDAVVSTQIPATVHWVREAMALVISAILTPIGLRAADREKHCLLSQVGLKAEPKTDGEGLYSKGTGSTAAVTKTESEDAQ